MMMELNEKVAGMSARLDGLNKRFEKHVDFEENYMRQQAKVMAEIRSDQAKMKGFWGGVVFVFSAIGVAAGIAISYLSGQR